MATRRQRGEGSVFQRNDGRWVGILDLGYFDGKRRRKHVYGRTQREAGNKLREARRQYEHTGTLATVNLTVEGWITQWLDHLDRDRSVAPSTLAGYRSKMLNVTQRIGTKRLDRLDAEQVREVYRWLADEGHAQSYIVQTHRILSRAIKDAWQEGKITRNVMEIVKTPKVGAAPEKTKPVALEQAVALVAQITGERDRLESRWLFQLTLGARQGEVLGLGWEDIDFDAGAVTIGRALQRQAWRHGCTDPCGNGPGRCPARHGGGLTFVAPKSEMSNRPIPLPPYLLEALRRRHAAWLAEEHVDLSGLGELAPDGLVWASPTGHPRDSKKDWIEWAALLKRAGVPHMGTHSARHGVASMGHDLGIPVKVVQEILGHADAALTMAVYTHADDPGKRRAVEAIEAAMRGTTTPPA